MVSLGFLAPVGLPSGHHRVEILAVKLPATVGADAVRELSTRMNANVGLKLLPTPVVVPDSLAVGADGQEATQDLDLRQCLLELAYQPLTGL